MTVIGNLATQGRLVNATKKIEAIAKGKIPRVMGKNYTIDRATQATEVLDDLRGTLGQAVKTSIEKVKDINIDVPKLQTALQTIKQLPKNVINALDDPIYQIEKLPDGSLNPSIQNIQKTIQALDDFMTTKTWEEASKMSQTAIKQNYGVLRQAMKDAAPSIKEPIQKYHEFMDMFHKVNKTLRTTVGDIVEKPLRGAFRKGAERGTQIAWEDFGKLSPKAQQVMTDIIKFNRRQGLKRGIAKGAGVLAGYEILRRGVVNPLLGKMGKE